MSRKIAMLGKKMYFIKWHLFLRVSYCQLRFSSPFKPYLPVATDVGWLHSISCSNTPFPAVCLFSTVWEEYKTKKKTHKKLLLSWKSIFWKTVDVVKDVKVIKRTSHHHHQNMKVSNLKLWKEDVVCLDMKKKGK